MTVQLDIFLSQNRDEGIKRAVDHADRLEDGWHEKAYNLLKSFLNNHRGPFMAEEVRSYAALIDFPLPPSARAWGGIIARAANEGIIEGRGYAPVKNIKKKSQGKNSWRIRMVLQCIRF